MPEVQSSAKPEYGNEVIRPTEVQRERNESRSISVKNTGWIENLKLLIYHLGVQLAAPVINNLASYETITERQEPLIENGMCGACQLVWLCTGCSLCRIKNGISAIRNLKARRESKRGKKATRSPAKCKRRRKKVNSGKKASLERLPLRKRK